MLCPETMRVQAYFDGELDALAAADIERHSEACSECRSLLQDLGQIRAVLRRDQNYVATPATLRATILQQLHEQEAPKGRTPSVVRRPKSRLDAFWRGVFAGVGGSVLAAGIAFFVVAPPLTNPVSEELVSAHIRSMMPDHLIDVVSTDKHTVKPWFASHADVSPVVADFAVQGYRLIGGRADYFDHQRVAVVVYQHGSHIINVFSWSAGPGSVPKNTTRGGYHLAFWRSGDLMYCAVSDTAWDELLPLTRLLRDLGAPEAPATPPPAS